MNESPPVVRVIPLRQHVIDDMNVRRFCRATQRNASLKGQRLYFSSNNHTLDSL